MRSTMFLSSGGLMKTSRIFAFLACLAFSITGAHAAEPTKVRVGFINNVQSAVLVHIKSIANEENLDVELVPFTRYPDVQKALSVHSIDVGVIAPNGLPTAVAQGDRNVVGVLDLVYGGNSFVMKKGVSVRTFQDLKGKRLGLAEGGVSWMMFVMLLDKNGMSYNDIQSVNFSGATDMINALKRGDVDGVDLWEPFVAQTVSADIGYATPAVNYRESPLSALNGLLGANKDFATKQSDALVRVLRLILKGEKQLQNDQAMWINIVRGYSNLDDATTKLALQGITYGGPQLSQTKMDTV